MESAKFSVCTVLNDEIYTLTLHEHILEQINKKTLKVNYIKDIDGYPDKGRKTINIIAKNDSFIYLVEYDGCRLIQLSLKNKKAKIYDIELQENGGFSSIEFFENYVYLFPCRQNYIVKIDIEKNTINKTASVFKNLEPKKDSGMMRTCSGTFCRKNKVYIFMKESNQIAVYDLKNDRFENYFIDTNQCGINAVHTYGNTAYLLDMEGKLWIFNQDTMKLELVIDTLEDNYYFIDFLICDSGLIFLPRFGENIEIYKDGELEIYRNYPEDIKFLKNKGHSKYYGYGEDENYYYVAMHSANYLLMINKHTGEFNWSKIKENYEEYSQYHEGVISEKSVDLREFIEHQIR